MNNKILVVEDDVGVRSFLLDTITLEGYKPVGVATAEDAIREIETEKYDIVLTDIRLPGKSGLELLLLPPAKPDAYLLVMTGYGTSIPRSRR
jgi:two-component system response regulator FlrC